MALRKALGEAAEALRRLFGAPKVHRFSAPALVAVGHEERLLEVAGRSALEPISGITESAPLFTGTTATMSLEPFEAALQTEEGWHRWAAEARVQRLPLFPKGSAAGGSVPPLPSGKALPLAIPSCPRPGIRSFATALGSPRAFRIPAQGFSIDVEKRLDPVLRRPFTFYTQDIQKLPKALWMRYSLALVKATGENVRNLEVLGLWQLPKKGVSGLRPDAEGRLIVQLSAEASAATRAAFMVARKKDDQNLVSAFVE